MVVSVDDVLRLIQNGNIQRKTRESRKGAEQTAYQDVHATKSQTLAYGLTDSPVALAAWITEKFHGWTDPEADAPLFTFDQLLTNIMIYWVTGSINTSMWLYRGLRDERGAALAEGEHVHQPLGFCLPPNDLVPPPPESWSRRLSGVPVNRLALLASTISRSCALYA